MSVPITNSAAFHAIIGEAVAKAMQELVDKMFDELQKDIEYKVYGSGTSDIATRELVNSWRHEAHGLFATLQFDPSMLPNAPDAWVHGSQYDPAWPDTRGLILDIIQGGYRAYNANTGVEIGDRPFWDAYVAKVNANFEKWARAALIHQGLAVI